MIRRVMIPCHAVRLQLGVWILFSVRKTLQQNSGELRSILWSSGQEADSLPNQKMTGRPRPRMRMMAHLYPLAVMEHHAPGQGRHVPKAQGLRTRHLTAVLRKYCFCFATIAG